MKKLKITFAIILILIVTMILGGYIFMRQIRFGAEPTGKRLERIQKSPNYKDGKFHNLSHTPTFAENENYFSVMKKFFFGKSDRAKPTVSLPHEKIDLKALDINENIVIWLGHSSYFLQIDGKRILVDPVLSGGASPIKAAMRSYPGSDAYTTDDIPDLDFVFITHDHWDHLDYETITAMAPRTKRFITALGVGAHLERWGIEESRMTELDWYESTDLGAGFKLTATPGRHFSGRSITRNGTLWISIVFKTPTMNIFINGDSGYDTHFKTIGDKFGPFDLALMECGQYNNSWKHIHNAPEQTVQSALDLKAKRFLPGHWAKFTLALHSWDEPIIRVLAESKKRNIPVLTPKIGAKVNLNDTNLVFEEWWKGIK